MRRPLHHRRRRIRAAEPPRPRRRLAGAGRPRRVTPRRSRGSTGRSAAAARRGSWVRGPPSRRRRGIRTGRLPPGTRPPRADHGPPCRALHRQWKPHARAGGEGPLSDQGQHPRTVRLAPWRGPVRLIRRRTRGAPVRRRGRRTTGRRVRHLSCVRRRSRGTRVRPGPGLRGRRQRPLDVCLPGREPGHRHHRQPGRTRSGRCPVGRGRVTGPPRRRHRAVERTPHRAIHPQRWHHLRSQERAAPVNDALHRSVRRGRPPGSRPTARGRPPRLRLGLVVRSRRTPHGRCVRATGCGLRRTRLRRARRGRGGRELREGCADPRAPLGSRRRVGLRCSAALHRGRTARLSRHRPDHRCRPTAAGQVGPWHRRRARRGERNLGRRRHRGQGLPEHRHRSRRGLRRRRPPASRGHRHARALLRRATGHGERADRHHRPPGDGQRRPDRSQPDHFGGAAARGPRPSGPPGAGRRRTGIGRHDTRIRRRSSGRGLAGTRGLRADRATVARRLRPRPTAAGGLGRGSTATGGLRPAGGPSLHHWRRTGARSLRCGRLDRATGRPRPHGPGRLLGLPAPGHQQRPATRVPGPLGHLRTGHPADQARWGARAERVPQFAAEPVVPPGGQPVPEAQPVTDRDAAALDHPALRRDGTPPAVPRGTRRCRRSGDPRGRLLLRGTVPAPPPIPEPHRVTSPRSPSC